MEKHKLNLSLIFPLLPALTFFPFYCSNSMLKGNLHNHICKDSMQFVIRETLRIHQKPPNYTLLLLI